jgi:hypothetical protein
MSGRLRSLLSVSEILTPVIPEILARLRTSRRDRKLLMLRFRLQSADDAASVQCIVSFVYLTQGEPGKL